MPELTERQQALFERLRHEGTVVLGGRERKTVEALVRRGIATYEAEYVLNEQHSYYDAYRFVVRLNLGSSQALSDNAKSPWSSPHPCPQFAHNQFVADGLAARTVGL
jgi:hypothetical protein